MSAFLFYRVYIIERYCLIKNIKKMSRVKLSQMVKENLQTEEKLAIAEVISAEAYNRYLYFCNNVYDLESDVVKRLEDNEIDNSIVFIVMKNKRGLVDESVLDKKIINKLEEVYEKFDKDLKRNDG